MSWNETKLSELRARYGDSHGGELHHPEFRKVAEKIFNKSGTRLAPIRESRHSSPPR